MSTYLNTPVRKSPASGNLPQRLSRLYELSQLSDFLFGSPLGPFHDDAHSHYLPHYAFCGLNSSPDSLRLAFYSGVRQTDSLVTNALLAFVEALHLEQKIGSGLNLAFFPVVNVRALLGGQPALDLSQEHWGRSRATEIQLLAQDAILRGYHGFIRLEGTDSLEPSALVRTVRKPGTSASGGDLFSSDDFQPWAVQFESVSTGVIESGPLSIVKDLPFTPFEIELSVPRSWSQAHADHALRKVLKRLIHHYRGFQSYALHL